MNMTYIQYIHLPIYMTEIMVKALTDINKQENENIDKLK